MNTFRQKEIYVSDEVRLFLKLDAKLACAGTTASMSADEMADCRLRDFYSREHPEWVVMYAELETARQQAKDRYKDIETRMMGVVKE